MGAIFDTADKGIYRAPPRGSCRVCTESASTLAPNDAREKSYAMIGDWSDPDSAIKHAKTAVEVYTEAKQEKTIVAFDFHGKEIFRASTKVASTPVEGVA